MAHEKCISALHLTLTFLMNRLPAFQPFIVELTSYNHLNVNHTILKGNKPTSLDRFKDNEFLHIV